MEGGPNGEVPEGHWFSLVRCYVCVYSIITPILLIMVLFNEQTTSIVMTVTYGKRAHKILNNRHL